MTTPTPTPDPRTLCACGCGRPLHERTVQPGQRFPIRYVTRACANRHYQCTVRKARRQEARAAARATSLQARTLTPFPEHRHHAPGDPTTKHYLDLSPEAIERVIDAHTAYQRALRRGA